jgi:hypothetical protein
MRLMALTAAVVVAVSVAATSVAAPAPSASLVRQFEGTVVSKDRATRTFRLHDSERGTKRIKVTRNTRFERINGFAGLKNGQRNIEATVKRRNGRWIAIEVEKSGGGGEHGGDDDRGGDDDGGRGRGSDDPPGDDNGGDRSGSDDR